MQPESSSRPNPVASRRFSESDENLRRLHRSVLDRDHDTPLDRLMGFKSPTRDYVTEIGKYGSCGRIRPLSASLLKVSAIRYLQRGHRIRKNSFMLPTAAVASACRHWREY